MESISTEADKTAAPNMEAPYISQDAWETTQLVQALEGHSKGKKAGFKVKKAEFLVENSPDHIVVDSWRFQDYDYKKRDLPTYARGLFTTNTRKGTPEIAIRGYDKFFNVGEVRETSWDSIRQRTKGPYELTLKENGCIIFIGGLADGTLLVCSKHSTGSRGEGEASHAVAGEERLEKQLDRIGKTKEDLARELRKRNVTAVAELCDDTFEEHILAYGPEDAGLYLHGMNLNVPEFATYPSPLVQQFADDWGFKKVGLITYDNVDDVKNFLEEVAETGAHSGRDVEGFVIRCKMTHDPNKEPFQDWFFKYKFEEPYLMYRQWRECTKAMIAGRQPRYKKHAKITEQYLEFARKRLATQPGLAKEYNKNHGIIALRNEFLAFKNMNGADAANFEDMYGDHGKTEVSQDLVLVPIATIGCGKTTIAIALNHLFGWGLVQNDNITGPKRPPRFTKALMEELEKQPVAFADRNNAQKHERKQLLTDVKQQNMGARLVALHFVHDDIDTIRRVTQERVYARGDNHQTIQAATDMNKVRGIMEGFIHRFEPCQPEVPPDDGFDEVIELDPAVGSRKNLETVIRELHRIYPKILPKVPTAGEMDEAIQYALENYKPDLRHTIPDRSGRNKNKPRNDDSNNGESQGQQQQQGGRKDRKKPLEYMSVDLAAKDVNAALERTFSAADAEGSRFFKQLKGSRRVQPKFHVTLMHRTGAKDRPELWAKYVWVQEAFGANTADGKLGDMNVLLERVVFDDRIMAVVVRLEEVEGGKPQGLEKWECVNRVAHVTVGTRDDSVKPRESNDLLARWLDEGTTEENKIRELVIEGKPTLKGAVRGVLSR
ncbi:tRNA ligase [Coniochaeta hoffmannii]|uniref:tRNA ligase n=1 Tax=Coniochaeta hoffmannii TaxID=91930 RepID=A0AA38VGU4_9PEZI|nr:tRNA ligase [Coniochaeta hoffmannii]